MLLKWAFLPLKCEFLPVQARAAQTRSKIRHLGTRSLCMASGPHTTGGHHPADLTSATAGPDTLV